MSAAPTITAIAPWFGGKRTLAPRIVAELGEHRCYWEPFCGSMSVLIAKPCCAMETVNDMLGELVNLARCIRDPQAGPLLYRRLRRVIASAAELDDAAGRLALRGRARAPELPDVELEFDYFVASWLGRNGAAGTDSYNQGFCRRFTASGGTSSTRWRGAVSSIPSWRRRLSNVTILNDDAFDVLAAIRDEPGTAIYCDPPYVEKNCSYVHDFSADDHDRLANALRRFTRARVVVSYYDHPRIRDLYASWSVVETPVAKALVNQAMRDVGGKVTAPEVLIINGPSLTAGGLFGGAH